MGTIVDDIQLYTLSLLIITIASVEFSIGFVLVIFFKKIFKTVDLTNTAGNDWTIVTKLNKY